MVYVFHVDGYEDTEMIAPLDMLSRAGIPMTRVGVTGKTITSKMGFTIEADITPEELDLSDCEMIFLLYGTSLLYGSNLCGTIRAGGKRRAGRQKGSLPFQRQ